MIRKALAVLAIFAIVADSDASEISGTQQMSDVDNCGLSSINTTMIAFGEDYRRGTFPWTVALMHKAPSSPKFFCGGTLISKDYVISGNEIDAGNLKNHG